jgi:hypothetical protein
MSKFIDPKEFNLSTKTVLEQTSSDHFAIVISRKSRIIMSDGKKILEKALKIKKFKPEGKVSLKVNAPLCGKTKVFFEENGIGII